MKKIFVTGSAGMLGKDIYRVLASNPGYEVYGFDINRNPAIPAQRQTEGFLSDYDMVRTTLERIRPEIIVHCAAVVNVDECETDHQLADTVHYRVTDFLSSWQKDTTRFIYISTDSVFDGKRGNYNEEDFPQPLNYYAASKLKGENAARKNNPSALILRTNIYGFNFPSKNALAQWALAKLQAGIPFTGFQDMMFNPLYTTQLAGIVHRLLSMPGVTGLLNLGSNAVLSKYDFVCRLASVFGYPESLVTPASSDCVPFKAPRPANTSLNVARMQGLGIQVPSLEQGLVMMKKEMEEFNKP